MGRYQQLLVGGCSQLLQGFQALRRMSGGRQTLDELTGLLLARGQLILQAIVEEVAGHRGQVQGDIVGTCTQAQQCALELGH